MILEKKRRMTGQMDIQVQGLRRPYEMDGIYQGA